MADKEKRAKKLSKKAARGEILSRGLFAECERLGIPVLPSVAITPVSSRLNCPHDLNVDELRELIVALVTDKPTSRYFQLLNKGALTHACCLHFTDCNVSSAELREVLPEQAVLRVSRSVSEASFLPRQLLSEAMETPEANLAVSDTGFGQYIHSEATLRAWLYPLPYIGEPIEPDEKPDPIESSDTELPDNCEGESLSKKPRMDNFDYNAVKGSHSWAVSAADTSAQLLASVPLVTVLEAPGRLRSDYRETLSYSSPEYSVLFKTLGSIHNHQREQPQLSLVSVDCEMCDTRRGLELTRVSLTDPYGSTVLDMFVRPSDPITNYRTQWSGITADIMDAVSHTLEEVQLAILRLVCKETILVGHSLDSDLKALRLCHRRCIDTSLLYPHPKSFPFRNKLKFLAQKYLNLNIQSNRSGHDSIEDARAAMQLVHLKVERGPTFGVPKDLCRKPILSGHGDQCAASFIWSKDECWGRMGECSPDFGKVSQCPSCFHIVNACR